MSIRIPQSNVPSSAADEAITKEMNDRLGRATTTASSLAAEQGSGNISKTYTKATPFGPSSPRTSLEDKRKEDKGDQAHDINWSDPSVLRYHALQNRPFSKAEVRKNMCTYLKNRGGYKQSYFKGLRLRPSASHKYSPLQLVSGREPSFSHLKVFGCGVYVPISPPQHTKMGPQRRLGIYVGFNFPSIIRYLEPLTGDVFTARFADCQFDETMFPILGGENKKLDKKDVTWNASLSFLDPRHGQCELEVQKIIHLQRIANELPAVFTDTKRVTKSYIPALNAPSRIDIPETLDESKVRRKHGRPVGSKDTNPWKRKEQNTPRKVQEVLLIKS
nr:putative ribonuclease H-like domain-containing protein [Tanacetum cinerariifolium]